MAGQSNRSRIDEALGIVAGALDPYIAGVVTPHVPAGHDWTALQRVRDEADGHGGKQYSRLDLQLQLKLLTQRYGSLGYLFNGHLSRPEQTFAKELGDLRNDLAHNNAKAYSADDAYRALDTAERLLRAIGAIAEADTVRKSRLDVQRSAYADEAKRDTKTQAGMPALSSADLAPWRGVLRPHADIAANDFARAEFAADLYQVAQGTETAGDYNDPIEFFNRTYLTDGLKTLLSIAARRVGGDLNAAPVVNLQTTFGGGKTHSMLAVWHLFSGRDITEYPQGVQDLVAGVDVDASVVTKPVKKVAIVGNELAPGQPWDRDGLTIHTLWGELAWQLGGADGYAMVAAADKTGTNPGSALRDLIAKHAPVVILIDEWVAYARGLYGRDDLPGGSFESQFSFAQQLTTVVKSIPGALLLVSIPASDVRRDDEAPVASDLEVGGAHGRAALERLQNIVSRAAENWTPASSVESFEIVRRRLFRDPDADGRRKIDATVKAFSDYYRANSGELPTETKSDDYARRIREAYPIHPELFDRLYGDWSTLERFQRTRGVLRLMSAVVHALEVAGDESPLIMPGSIPLEAPAVRDELTSYLDDAWKSILEKDVDGANATSRLIDEEKPLFKPRALTRRIARATFMGSAATLQTNHKGIERKSIFLGVAMPGDTIGNFGSALSQLGDRSTYLYSDAGRYWFDRQPSLNRKVAERAESYSLADVWAEVVTRLGRQPKSTPEIPEVLVAPTESIDVAESERLRLVILHPRHTHDGKGKESDARDEAHEFATKRGQAPRVNANTVVMLAADETRRADLEQAVRHYKAWNEIRSNKVDLDLTQSQAAEAGKKADSLNETVEQRIRETYIWALHPEQSDGAQPLRIAATKIDGATESVVRHVGERLKKHDLVIVQTSPQALSVELRNHLKARWNDGRISAGDLWEYHVRYPYLARLKDKSVLLDGISAVMHEIAWQEVGFALADGYDETTGEFIGLSIPLEGAVGAILDTTLLVDPRLAKAPEPSGPPPQPPAGPDGPGPGPVPEPEPTPPDVANARYSAVIDLKPASDLGAQLKQIAEEVLIHLQKAGADTLEVRLTVDAGKHVGFDTDTVRRVRENGSTLGFSKNRFESL